MIKVTDKQKIILDITLSIWISTSQFGNLSVKMKVTAYRGAN
jgi:hypothetical protein